MSLPRCSRERRPELGERRPRSRLTERRPRSRLSRLAGPGESRRRLARQLSDRSLDQERVAAALPRPLSAEREPRPPLPARAVHGGGSSGDRSLPPAVFDGPGNCGCPRALRAWPSRPAVPWDRADGSPLPAARGGAGGSPLPAARSGAGGTPLPAALGGAGGAPLPAARSGAGGSPLPAARSGAGGVPPPRPAPRPSFPRFPPLAAAVAFPGPIGQQEGEIERKKAWAREGRKSYPAPSFPWKGIVKRLHDLPQDQPVASPISFRPPIGPIGLRGGRSSCGLPLPACSFRLAGVDFSVLSAPRCHPPAGRHFPCAHCAGPHCVFAPY